MTDEPTNKKFDPKSLRPPGSKCFVKGNSGGPGRKVGAVSGRKRVMQLLDTILSQPEAQQKIAEAMLSELMKGNKSALGFLKEHVYPNTPKESIVTLNGDENDATRKKVVRVIMAAEGAQTPATAGAPTDDKQQANASNGSAGPAQSVSTPDSTPIQPSPPG